MLTTMKWLCWLSAAGFLLLALAGPLLIHRSIGMLEVIVTLLIVAVMSAPGWLIHFSQKHNHTS